MYKSFLFHVITSKFTLIFMASTVKNINVHLYYFNIKEVINTNYKGKEITVSHFTYLNWMHYADKRKSNQNVLPGTSCPLGHPGRFACMTSQRLWLWLPWQTYSSLTYRVFACWMKLLLIAPCVSWGPPEELLLEKKKKRRKFGGKENMIEIRVWGV